MTHAEFIEDVAKAVKKYAPIYGISVYSPIIAQAILESGWGATKLASRYHNYFGLKSGSRWRGGSVTLKTMEQSKTGAVSTIYDRFRIFESLDTGIQGYFDFIQLPRYANLRGITDPETYLKTIKADGYATDIRYVEKNMQIIRQYDLTKYDNKETVMARTAEAFVNTMRGWVGKSEPNGGHKEIIDLYNSHRPLARGYKVRYSDSWCDATISAAAIKTGMTDLIGTECGVEEHVKIFKQMGIWEEDGTITPKPGYIIIYNWDDATQPNDGYSDHIGAVDSVKDGQITVIEGNYKDRVGYRTIPVGWGYIRGYAIPKYESASSTTTPSKELNRTQLWVGMSKVDDLNVRSWAGKQYPNIKKYPRLNQGNLIDICDTLKDDNGADWYYARIAGKIYGFVKAEFITRI